MQKNMIEFPYEVTRAEFFPKGDFAILSNKEIITKISIPELEIFSAIPINIDPKDIEVSSSGLWVYFASHSGLWKLDHLLTEDGEKHLLTSSLTSLRCFPSSFRVMVGGFDGSLTLFSEKDQSCKKLSSIHTQQISAIVKTFDDKYFFSAADDKKIVKWNLEFLTICQVVELEHGIFSMNLRPGSDKLLAGIWNGKYYSYSAKNLTHQNQIVHCCTDRITFIKELKDGQIVTGSVDSRISFHVPSSESIFYTNKNPTFACYDENLMLVADCKDGKNFVKLLNLETKKIHFQIKVLMNRLNGLRRDSDDFKSNYLSILGDHISQATGTEISSKFFKGTLIKFQPHGVCISIIQPNIFEKSRHCNGTKEGQVVLNLPDCTITRVYSKGKAIEFFAKVKLLKEKVVFFGEMPVDSVNPKSDMRIKEVLKGSVRLVFEEFRNFGEYCFCGKAKAIFSNGEISGFFFDGNLVFKENVPTILDFDSESLEIVSQQKNSVVETACGSKYHLNFNIGKIIKIS